MRFPVGNILSQRKIWVVTLFFLHVYFLSEKGSSF